MIEPLSNAVDYKVGLMERSQLRRMIADLSIENLALKEINSKKW